MDACRIEEGGPASGAPCGHGGGAASIAAKLAGASVPDHQFAQLPPIRKLTAIKSALRSGGL
jgi:hypothetical protein